MPTTSRGASFQPGLKEVGVRMHQATRLRISIFVLMQVYGYPLQGWI